MLLGAAVMINWSDVAPEHRGACYEWHSREHMVGRVALPGFRRGRRYIAAKASRDFLVRHGSTSAIERDTYTLQIMVTK
jgi:hypothetical protein